MSRPVLIFHHKGDFKKTDTWLRRIFQKDPRSIMDKYGLLGVAKLIEATPKRTGKTANSWDYYVERTGSGYKLVWTNSNRNEGVPIALLIQYGHGTRGGTFVTGIDYINPTLKPVFEELADALWKEVAEL